MTGLAEVQAAAELLRGVTDRTPVQLSRALSHVVGAEVWLKCENLQRAGSFKLRGAYVRMARLSAQERARGVVAASAGNHAQGVALAARMLGIESVVFMPVDAALPKVAATREYGARVEAVGASVDEALRHAHEYAERTGAVLSTRSTTRTSSPGRARSRWRSPSRCPTSRPSSYRSAGAGWPPGWSPRSPSCVRRSA